MPNLEITEALLVHFNIAYNSALQSWRVLYTFVHNNSFGELFDILPKNFIFLKAFNSEFSYNLSYQLKYNISKMTRYSGQPRDQVFVKGYGFLSFTKKYGQKFWQRCK